MEKLRNSNATALQQLTPGRPGDNPGNTEDSTTTDPAGVLRKESRQAAGSNPQNDPYITAVVRQLQAAQTSGDDQGQTIATADTATARIATSASASAPPQNISWNDPQIFLRMAAGKTATAIH